jgi:hypothetical protein
MNALACGIPVAALVLTCAASWAAGRTVALLDWSIDVPANWVQRPPESSMRLAQFEAATSARAAPVQVVVFYFGPSGGGPVQANIQRWESQFSASGGAPVRARVREGRTGAGPVTWAELRGTYARGVGMGPQGQPKPGQTLLAAIVETPKGNLTFQMFGASGHVAAQRAAFEVAVQGLRCARPDGC